MSDQRNERITRAMAEFYEKAVHDQIIMWHLKKQAQEKNPNGQCVICKSLKLPQGISGKAAKFERHADGRLTAICGGRDGVEVCPGYNIMREPYVDQATITKEIKETLRLMRQDLKIIRDRVLATETLTKEDENEFRSMTNEYARLKKIEEEHKEEIGKISDEYNQVTMIDDEILVPNAYFGDTVGMIMKTPMLPTEKRTGGLENGEYPEVVMIPICKEDIPVRVMIDEPTDNS